MFTHISNKISSVSFEKGNIGYLEKCTFYTKKTHYEGMGWKKEYICNLKKYWKLDNHYKRLDAKPLFGIDIQIFLGMGFGSQILFDKNVFLMLIFSYR